MSSGIDGRNLPINIFLRKKSSRKNRLAAKYNKELDIDYIKESFYDELFFNSWKKKYSQIFHFKYLE